LKRSDPYKFTRGKWKYCELAWAVLVVLDVTGRAGYPPLTARAIAQMTDVNYKSLISSLRKWVELHWVKRHGPDRCRAFIKPCYSYSITKTGKRRMLRMEMPRQRGTFSFTPGVDREAVLRRLPIFKGKNY